MLVHFLVEHGDITPKQLEHIDMNSSNVVPSNAEAFLSVSETATHLGVSISLLNKWRVVGNGPTFVKLGRLVRYRLSDIHEWAANNKFGSTSQY